MRANISIIVDLVIDGIEREMEENKKFFIRTQTIKRRVSAWFHHGLTADDEDINYLARIGLEQVIQSRLYYRDYRSVRSGFFVCVSTCDNEQILNVILDSALENAESKQKVVARLAELKAKKTGQTEMTFSGSDFSGYVVPKNESEFMRDIAAYAI